MSTVTFLLLAVVALCLFGYLFLATTIGVVGMKITLAVIGILAAVFLVIDRDNFRR